MKTAWFAGLSLVGVSTTLLFPALSTHTRRIDTTTTGVPARVVLYYRDPMHPSYTSNKPGKAPDCGMDLEGVYADQNDSAQNTMSLTHPGLVQVSLERQEMIGVRVGRVDRARTTHTLRTLGRVAVDENRVFPITAGGDGWVTEILPGAATGNVVRRGQSLARIYGREYATAQRTFLYALRASENPAPVVAGDAQGQLALTLQESRLALESLGFGQAQIERLVQTRQVTAEMTLSAPASGVIVARHAFAKQKFDRGAELFSISDLSHVWIVADVFSGDAAYIPSGASAFVSIPDRPATTLRATVGEALPRFDTASRTLKVRLEAANPNLMLRPDMFVDLEFPIGLPEATTVPADAIVESGLQKTVFVDHGDGMFEPRAVETGWRFGGRVQIVHGLNAGESIVVSGNFLLDSERRMQQRDTGVHD